MSKFFDWFAIVLVTVCLIMQIVSYNGNIGAVLGWVCALSAQATVLSLKSELNGGV